MKLALLTPAIGSGNAGDAMIESAIRRLVPADRFERFTIRQPLSAAEMTALNDCDAAVLCGSNLYQQKRQCVINETFLDQLRIPLVPLGVGVSAASGTLPQVSESDAALIRQIHSRCAASSVRDGATLRFVQSIGVKNARLTGCPVLFHGLRRPEMALRTERPPAISLRRTFLHGAEPLEDKQWPLLEALCAAHRPTLVCQGAYDLPQARRLAARYDLEILYDDDWHCDIHQWLAARQQWTGGFRLHHGMLSLSHGTPAWFISHDTRVEEFCQMMGLPWLDIRTAKPEDVLEWGPDRMGDFDRVPEHWDRLSTDMAAVLAANGLPCALHEPPPAKRKVLFLVPRRAWAYDFSARALQAGLEPHLDVRIRYSTDMPALRPEPYDAAVVFFWGEQEELLKGFDPNRIIKYVSSHRWQFPGKHGPHTPAEFAAKYLGNAGTLFATSKRLFHLLEGVHPRVRHAPNGYDPEVFHSAGPRQGIFTVGAAGWAADLVKGLRDLFVQAVQGYSFALAGGDIGHEKMNAFYNQLDVLLVCSSHEGEPLTLIEAMATGCFPVASDVGIVPELVVNGENGIIVKERSAEAFQEALAWCSKNLDRVREMGAKNAELMIRQRSWAVLLPQLLPLFQEAVSHAGAPRFFITADAAASPAVERVAQRLAYYRQAAHARATPPPPGAVNLADDAGAGWSTKKRWALRPGVNYVIHCTDSGPEGLGWDGLERCLREALLPGREHPQPWPTRLRSTLRRWRAALLD